MQRRLIASFAVFLSALGIAAAAQAQYKIVDPSGRVTYTDRPQPAAGARIEPIRPSGATAVAAGPTAGLPFELRQVAERYPVMLYTTDPCDACAAGRTLLRQRGIPFSEKTVRTEADRQAFQRAESASELPVVRIGTQQLRGYSDVEWSSYLDAAGYPRESRLPANYRPPEPTALAPARPAAAVAEAAPAAPQPPAALPPALETAPQGIRF